MIFNNLIFRNPEGHVTSTCLWHACRAVTIGSLLIVMGMAMSILGECLSCTTTTTDYRVRDLDVIRAAAHT